MNLLEESNNKEKTSMVEETKKMIEEDPELFKKLSYK